MNNLIKSAFNLLTNLATIDLLCKLVISSKLGGSFLFSNSDEQWVSQGLCVIDKVPLVPTPGKVAIQCKEPVVVDVILDVLEKCDVNAPFYTALDNLSSVNVNRKKNQ